LTSDTIVAAAAIVAVIIVVVLVAFWRIRHPIMHHGEILLANEMQKKYGLYVERYKPPKLDPDQVPEALRDLLPLAAKWGIGDDIIRSDLQSKVGMDEQRELQEALKGRSAAITRWLDSFGTDPMSAEAGAFMYMLLGIEEMGHRIE
jgi:hypothetical protein